ncbi:hypothetical protein AGMMS50239_05210 [Bacteroidia bacterium]|nr:hypothetical protein AGMMS50239_05210 [Bacteroidia bacterium]
MYRQIFTPTEHNHVVPVTIPKEWYGREVEIIVSPITITETKKETREERFMKLFGAWESDKSAEEIIAEIYNSRTSGKTRILEEL